jgi:signal peptidase
LYHNLRKNGTDEVRIERSRMRNVKVVDTREYVGMLKELTEEGKEVSMLVFGSSMAPFLIHARDMIYFKKPDRELQKGDIVFFRRKSGQFVMHRIWKIRPEGYYIVGDAQTQIEGPVKREQIFALITKVRRKEKWLEPGDFWWEFFEHVWLHMIPLRRGIMWCYAKVIR